MSLRRLDEIELVAPTEGAVSIAVARHLTSTWPDPDLALLHERRAQLIHGLVDELKIKTDDVDWGATDSPHPSEIVEVVVPIAAALITMAGGIIAAWIQRPERNARDNKGVMGVKLRRADGAVLELTYERELPRDEMATMIDTFLRGGSKSGKKDPPP
jgi:hypothetical protein